MNQFKANYNEIVQEFINRDSWKGTILSPVILMTLVVFASQDLLFQSYRETCIGVFTISIAMVWIGVFNSISLICNIRAKIKIQYIQGMRISSFVAANVVFQFLKCVIQALISCVVFSILGRLLCDNFPDEGLLISITFDILMIMIISIFAADMLGLLISSISPNSVTAMTLMPGFLVFEMVFSNALFTLPDFCNNILGKITDLTICKWSTSLLGTVCNVEALPGYIESEAPDIVFTFSSDNFIHGLFFLIIHIVICIFLVQLRLLFLSRERVF